MDVGGEFNQPHYNCDHEAIYHQNNPFLDLSQWLSIIPLPKEISRNVLWLPSLKALRLDGIIQSSFNEIGTFLVLALFMLFKKFLRLLLFLKIGVPQILSLFQK